MLLRLSIALLAGLAAAPAFAQTATQSTIQFSYNNCRDAGCPMRVPPKVTSFTVEAWGGGGGGSNMGGGQGGSYLKAILPVVPTVEYTVSIGGGGVSGSAGGATVVQFLASTNPVSPLVTLTAQGGAAGGSVAGGFSNSAATGTGAMGLSNPFYFIGCFGQPGTNTPAVTFVQTNPAAGTLLASATGGRGGDACTSPQSGGSGASQLAFGLTSNTFVLSVQHLVTPSVPATSGAVPGGGGGGSTLLTTANSGASGAPGYVLITYTNP